MLGDGTFDESLSPKAVRGGAAFVELTSGYNHTCGRTVAETVYCWGHTLGSRTERRPVPTLVAAGFIQLAAGRDHQCGLKSPSVAYCWGGNGNGQLGDGTTGDRPEPVPVR